MNSFVFYRLNNFNFSDFVDEIAHVHKISYTGSHLTSSFSVDMLTQYYSSIYRNADMCVVAMDGEQVIGYIFAGYRTSVGVSEFLKSNKFQVLRLAFSHPRPFLSKFGSTFLMRFRSRPKTSYPFRLLSIAVHPHYQGEGLSTELLQFFETELRSIGCFSYGLSVKGSNRRAIKFYQKSGFKIECEMGRALYFGKQLCTHAESPL